MREDLRQAGYTVEGMGEVLGPVASAALHREQPLPATRVTDRAAGGAAATLLRCFVLGLPVGSFDLEVALPRTGVGGLLSLGLVRRSADGAGGPGVRLQATCDLRPYGTEQENWWVASDLSGSTTRGPLPTDHVLGIGGASTTLASWTPRPHVGRALDLGTGCGVQALHLASHTTERVATDLSDRALQFARFTLALNGVEVDLRRGNLLDPVEGERFNLIVSNPPFHQGKVVDYDMPRRLIAEAATRAVRLIANGEAPTWVGEGDPSGDPAICG